MHFILPTLLLPAALTLAAPTPLASRQTEPCAPTSYTLNGFQYRQGKFLSSDVETQIQFNFMSNYSDPSIIEDPAYDPTGIPEQAAVCYNVFPGKTLPGEIECSTGRNNFFYSVRDPENHIGDFQFIHQWKCNGQTWMSSTHHQIESLDCSQSDEQGTKCSTVPQSFLPEAVRRICAGPTCQ